MSALQVIPNTSLVDLVINPLKFGTLKENQSNQLILLIMIVYPVYVYHLIPNTSLVDLMINALKFGILKES